MAETADGDILMYFLPKGAAVPLTAESQSELTPGDSLTNDFRSGLYFQADTFSFSMKLGDDEAMTTGKSAGRSYSRWRAMTTDVKPVPPYHAKPDEFVITRMVDCASPELLTNCLKLISFDKVVLVKRARSAGGALTGILKLEFDQVFVRSVEWDDGVAIKETCKFNYTGLKVTYRKRKPDGSTASSWPCKWDSNVNG